MSDFKTKTELFVPLCDWINAAPIGYIREVFFVLADDQIYIELKQTDPYGNPTGYRTNVTADLLKAGRLDLTRKRIQELMATLDGKALQPLSR